MIEHCHSKGILHRDLKPENFLLKERNGSIEKDNVRAVDFGLSTAHVSGQVCKKVVGSAYYLAPEVLKVAPPLPPPLPLLHLPSQLHYTQVRWRRTCTRTVRTFRYTDLGYAFSSPYVSRIPLSLVGLRCVIAGLQPQVCRRGVCFCCLRI